MKRFLKDEKGVALVEFALLLPLLLLSFFVIVEFTRLFFSYQGAIAGVRDAVRYMARTQPIEICDAHAGNYAEYAAPQTTASGYNYYAIVQGNMDIETVGLLPRNVVLNSVQSGFYCEENTTLPYRKALLPMAEIVATFTITFPLVGILELNGQPVIAPITHVVRDQSRIYGI